MRADLQTITWMLFLAWFIIYWVLGGVFFALIAATRFMNLSKARFSCLFTLGSLAAAYGASTIGMMLAGMNRVARCPKANPEAFHALGELVVCNYSAIFVAGSMFFALLCIGGMVALLFSRVEKVVPAPTMRR